MKIILIISILVKLLNPCWGQLSFTERASSLGVGYSYGSSFHGGGVSFADFNQDGRDDLTFSTEFGKEIYFFRNDISSFTKIQLTGITNSYETKQVLWVDYDNDGDLDFFAASTDGPNKLYQNDGNLSFTDVTSSSGIFTEDLNTFGASFGDIDNDGDLDLFISNRGILPEQRNYLYRNDGGSFMDITVAAGINTNPEQSFCAAFFDLNNDGYQDIYVANDKFTNINRLYKNKGDGTFEDISMSSGTGVNIDAMSTTISDYNRDGWLDIYVTNTSAGNYLFRNNGDETFTNVAGITGTTFNSVAWGAVFLDADKDSHLDLYVSGSRDGSSGLLPAAFYYNDGYDMFTIPSNIGFQNDNRISYSNAIGDFNNDGAPDIVVMNDTENYFLWENSTFSTNNWIKIKLEGVHGNKDGIGNRIEVRASGVSQYRYTLCGEGYLGQNSSHEFVGIGNATVIDYIKITWNHSGQVETLYNIAPNQAVTIQEGNGVLNTSAYTFSEFKVFPNPGQAGIFTIYFNDIPGDRNIEVYTISGKLLFSRKSKLEKTKIDLSPYAEGIYFAKVHSGNATATVKLIHR
ncbi:MAG: T9SS type A sorting domain-containing protein [Flavobacteriaceae bacterium]|nr:MAG: T9SS type A sorting domain-containing protein [Flavobacteriaceae bacterium]